MDYTTNNHETYVKKHSSGTAKAGLATGIVGAALGGLAFLGNHNGLGGVLGGGNVRPAVVAAEVEQSIIANQAAEIAELKSMRYTDGIGLELYKSITSMHDEDLKAISNVQTQALVGIANLGTEVALNKQANELNRQYDIMARDYQFRILDDKVNCCCEKTAMQIDFNRQLGALADASIISYVNSNFLPGSLYLPITSVCPTPAVATTSTTTA